MPRTPKAGEACQAATWNPHASPGRRRPCEAWHVSAEKTSAARLYLHVRSDPPDEFGGLYESECRPGGPYGALKQVPGGPYGALKLVRRPLPRPYIAGTA